MSDWSSFNEQKDLTDSWRSFLKERASEWARGFTGTPTKLKPPPSGVSAPKKKKGTAPSADDKEIERLSDYLEDRTKKTAYENAKLLLAGDVDSEDMVEYSKLVLRNLQEAKVKAKDIEGFISSGKYGLAAKSIMAYFEGSLALQLRRAWKVTERTGTFGPMKAPLSNFVKYYDLGLRAVDASLGGGDENKKAPASTSDEKSSEVSPVDPSAASPESLEKLKGKGALHQGFASSWTSTPQMAKK